MPNYKTKNPTALANSSEEAHQVASKRKLVDVELESEYIEETFVALPPPSKRTCQEKVISHNMKNSGLLNTLHNTKDTPISSPGVFKSNSFCVEESIEVPPEIKCVDQKYSRTRGSLPKPYEKDGEPQSSSVSTTSDIVGTTSILRHVLQYGVTRSGNLYFPKTKLQNIEPQTLHSNSNPIVLEPLDLRCDQDIIEVTPLIQHSTLTDSQTKGRSSKSCLSGSVSDVSESAGDDVQKGKEMLSLTKRVAQTSKQVAQKSKNVCSSGT